MAARQRRFGRFAVEAEARLRPGRGEESAGPALIARVRDIGRSGMGAVADEFVAPGQFWRVELESQGITVASLPAVVRYCRKIGERGYRIGMEFGIEAGILLALGVDLHDLIRRDTPEALHRPSPDFVAPEELTREKAHDKTRDKAA